MMTKYEIGTVLVCRLEASWDWGKIVISGYGHNFD